MTFSLAACGPSPAELAAREEARQRAEELRVAQEQERARVEAERIAAEKAAAEARAAELRRAESVADRAARSGDATRALTGYSELLALVAGNPAEELRVMGKAAAFAGTLEEAPEVPEAARRRAVRAQALLKAQPEAFAQAAVELKEAVKAAPWWAEAYHNLGMTQAGAKDYAGAVQSLKLELQADPRNPARKALQNKIYEFEVLDEEEKRVSGIAGTDWKNSVSGRKYTVTIKDNQIEARSDMGWVVRAVKSGLSLEGTVTSPSGKFNSSYCYYPEFTSKMTGSMSPDLKEMRFSYTENLYGDRYWTGSGGLINTSGHYEGECIEVVLMGTRPGEFKIQR